jgi:protein-tyrosine phosphatase
MKNFWIPGPWTGKLAITTRPRGGEWLEDEVRAWRGAGIDVVVSLLTAEESLEFGLTAERELCERHVLRFFQFPIADLGIPTSREAALALLSKLEGLLARGRNVAIHCRQSIGRSGLMAASLLVMSGSDALKALETVSLARELTVPETSQQREWVIEVARELTPSLAQR